MNIALIGYGKMGREIEKIALERGHSISHRFDINTPFSALPGDATDCLIDFSTALAVESNVSIAMSGKIPIVVGTTGWSDKVGHVRSMVEQAKGSLVYASNFSVGANILFRIVADASAIFNRFDQYDVSIHETHHAMKKDAPSGTALTLAQKVLTAIERKNKITSTSASPKELFVSSSRVGTVVGEHTVRFNSQADDIAISHTAHSRSGFALGAVLAAEWIVKRKGFFTFEELLWGEKETVSF